MSRRVGYLVLSVVVLAMGGVLVCQVGVFDPRARSDAEIARLVATAYAPDARYAGLEITDPYDDTQFPPEIAAPTFRWRDEQSGADLWLVTAARQEGEESIEQLCRERHWTPSAEQWQRIKEWSRERDQSVVVLGVSQTAVEQVLSAGRVSLRTSTDEVGAPIFYREVNLPFIDAVKDPSRIRWRFGEISSPEQPRIVLENLPVCGNCHSFSADGAVMGMDVDYANDKGSYVLAPVEREMVLDEEKIITWAAFQRRDGTPTFGLLSQVSPNGRYVVSTVKDQSVFVPTPDLTFSQLFFPIQGILVIYDRVTGTFRPLPGADDPELVQSNPTWSPDGKYIVFARSKVHRLRNQGERRSLLLTPEDCAEFLEEGKTFQFDLYRVPFNDGDGGQAEPLKGASQNGMSNYFARYSPNGKWIVFCKAASFMLLQPDSELYIVPAAGGEAERLQCNTRRMNSWHSWSPNSKWLVFSSKANTPYTQLFLTHIDEQGRSSPPVLLSHFTSGDRAANIPEFVNVPIDALVSIRERFVDDYSFVRSGSENLKYGDPQAAERLFRKALELNPDNPTAHNNLGTVLAEKGAWEEAKLHFTRAIACDPRQRDAHYNLGSVLTRLGRTEEALASYREAVRLDPDYFPAQLGLGAVLMQAGKLTEATRHLSDAVRLAPRDATAQYQLGLAWHGQGKQEQAASCYERAVMLQPDYVPALIALASIRALTRDARLRDHRQAVQLAERACEATHYQDPMVLDALAGVYAAAGRMSDAVAAAQLALRIARASGARDLAESIAGNLERYEHQASSDKSGS